MDVRIAINAWFWDRPTTGSGQYTQHLSEYLVSVAPALDVVLVGPRATFSPACASTSGLRFRPVTLPRRWPADLSKVWFEQVLFPRACAALGADVAHVPYWAPPMWCKPPVVVTVHDLIPLLLPAYRGGPLARLYTGLVSATVPRAALLFTDSDASRRDVLAHLAVDPARVRTVYLAADGRFSPQATPGDAAARARYGLPERYALYLAGFDVRKNLATVVGAYRWAGPSIGTACPLVIAGRLPQQDSAFAPDPRRLVRELGVDEAFVHFPGFIDQADKPALYRGAAAFLFPSRYEGFGLPPLEALACGTPVVGSDVSSMPEIVGKAGVLLPPDDVEGMAKALIRLATDGEFRAALSRRALAQAARFSWAQTARQTLAAYREVRGWRLGVS
ncbi:MAG TPA: glycosyltransferase family 1 protein [Chloroflexi bacterium]|nr:glycosyltransferase family 1 protein [Chloroflexota bacterium]